MQLLNRCVGNPLILRILSFEGDVVSTSLKFWFHDRQMQYQSKVCLSTSASMPVPRWLFLTFVVLISILLFRWSTSRPRGQRHRTPTMRTLPGNYMLHLGKLVNVCGSLVRTILQIALESAPERTKATRVCRFKITAHPGVSERY